MPIGTDTFCVAINVGVAATVEDGAAVEVALSAAVAGATARAFLLTGVGVIDALGTIPGKISGVNTAHINTTTNTPTTAPMARRLFPFGLGRQAFAHPRTVTGRIVPTDENHREALPICRVERSPRVRVTCFFCIGLIAAAIGKARKLGVGHFHGVDIVIVKRHDMRRSLIGVEVAGQRAHGERTGGNEYHADRHGYVLRSH